MSLLCTDMVVTLETNRFSDELYDGLRHEVITFVQEFHKDRFREPENEREPFKILKIKATAVSEAARLVFD